MIKDKDSYLTTAEVAKFLGFTHDYVRKMIAHKKLKAEKLGRNWIVNMRDLEKISRQRSPRSKGREKVNNGTDE